MQYPITHESTKTREKKGQWVILTHHFSGIYHQVCLLICQDNEMTCDLDIWHAGCP